MAQAAGAAGAGNVVRSSALFTIILRQAQRPLLPEKPMILNAANESSKKKASSKKTIVQVVIIVIAIHVNIM